MYFMCVCNIIWSYNDKCTLSWFLLYIYIYIYIYICPQIWLDDVECVGSESSIFLCPKSDWGQHNCGHHEDASAVCSGM